MSNLHNVFWRLVVKWYYRTVISPDLMCHNLFKSLLVKSVILTVTIFSVSGCSNEPGIWKNDEIKTSKRDDFHKLNKQLLQALKAGEASWLEDILSKELLESHYINRQAHLVSLQMKKGDFDLQNEFYVINDQRGPHSIKDKVDGNEYNLNYDALQQEMYMAFFVPKNGQNKWMLTAVYYKYNYGWKLFSLDFNPYTENGKTAPGLLKTAQDKYAQHYLVDAVNIAGMARDCARPNDMWRYAVEDKIAELYGKAMYEANQAYKFPFTITQVPTKPSIIRIVTQDLPEGRFPAIYYLSSVNVSDTNALKRENAGIQKVIGQVIPGIDQDKKYVIYHAYNEMPKAKESISSFEMVDKL